jgi:hypothetical protein
LPGMQGAIIAHSSSVVSLAYRSPSRQYFARVISVQTILCLRRSSQPRLNHK